MSDQREEDEECACVECARGPGAIRDMIEEGIQRVGWVLIPIVDGLPRPFAYTVGLTETYNHPELIIIGFPPQAMCQIIGEAVAKLEEDGEAFKVEEVPGVIKVKVHGVLQDGLLGCRDVTKKNKLELLCRAVARYGEDGFEAKQLVFPDMHGILPWQPNFNEEWGQCQPKLYTPDENEAPL